MNQDRLYAGDGRPPRKVCLPIRRSKLDWLLGQALKYEAEDPTTLQRQFKLIQPSVNGLNSMMVLPVVLVLNAILNLVFTFLAPFQLKFLLFALFCYNIGMLYPFWKRIAWATYCQWVLSLMTIFVYGYIMCFAFCDPVLYGFQRRGEYLHSILKVKGCGITPLFWWYSGFSVFFHLVAAFAFFMVYRFFAAEQAYKEYMAIDRTAQYDMSPKPRKDVLLSIVENVDGVLVEKQKIVTHSNENIKKDIDNSDFDAKEKSHLIPPV